MARARAVRANAHAPYSGYAVGAAVRAEDGSIHVGCNVENAAYRITSYNVCYTKLLRHVHALGERNPARPGERAEAGAQLRVVGVDHVDEATVADRAGERIERGEIDVVGDQRHRAGPGVGTQRP